jgi:DNA-binding MarR family transcriptional regulator
MSTDLQELGRAVKKLQNRHHRMFDTRLAKIGTTLAQWDALRAVEWNAGASSHVLAEFTFQTDQSFGALATKLVEKGLLERTPGRGRALSHRLTTAGRDILVAGTEIATQVLSESFEPLNPAELDQLALLIGKLIEGPPD